MRSAAKYPGCRESHACREDIMAYETVVKGKKKKTNKNGKQLAKVKLNQKLVGMRYKCRTHLFRGKLM